MDKCCIDQRSVCVYIYYIYIHIEFLRNKSTHKAEGIKF